MGSIGCINNGDIFAEGRLEDTCNDAIPICNTQAACTLQNDEFYSGSFPGGLRIVTRTETENANIVVRFLLNEMNFPGTEILVQARTPDCGDYDEKHPKDIDLFRLAGDDRILEFQLEMPGKGDHLVEIFSDMAAEYLMTTEVEEKL